MQYKLTLRIFEEEPSFGKGVIELLDRVDQFGSLSKAYKDMHMSSSKAWKILNRAQNDLGFDLVESKSGGMSGGGTVLTEKGKELLKQYKLLYDEIDAFTKERFNYYFGA